MFVVFLIALLIVLNTDSYCFFFSSRRRHTSSSRDWSSDVCSSDLSAPGRPPAPTSTTRSGASVSATCWPPLRRTPPTPPSRSRLSGTWMARGRWCGWSGAARRSGSTGSPPARRRGEAAMRPTSLCPAPRGQEPVRPAPPREPPWPWLGLWAVVAVVVGALVRVLGPAVLDPDEYAAALYFDDLVHGRRLQEFLLSAPKPLLTLVHGVAWAVTHDWRAGTALTVAAFALAVTALARAAGRLAGGAAGPLAGVPAALAVVVAMVGSGALILQVARGNSVIWALSGWAVALDALARPRRRWGLAATALLLAALARAETWLLLPPAALLGLLAWRRGDRRALLLLVPLAAPLLWLGHDYLLAGDALYSLKVPERYTDLISGRQVIP